MKMDIFKPVRLHGVNHTAELSSATSILLLSQAPRYASHRGVKLCGVSQTAHCEIKIEIFVSLWLLLNGQSGEILLGVKTSIMKENI